MKVLLVVLLIGSLLLNIAQGVKITNIKNKRKCERLSAKFITDGVIKALCDLNNYNDDVERRLRELERKSGESDTRITEVEKRVEELENINGLMANNNYQLMKEGKIIKTKINNIIYPYRFDELNASELTNFFGYVK